MTQWTDALPVDELPDQDVLGLQVAGRDLALYTVGDDVYATDGMCTHGHALLCTGFMDGHEIECPLHQGKFDVRDGRATCAPAAEPLRTYPVKIEAGRVYIQLD